MKLWFLVFIYRYSGRIECEPDVIRPNGILGPSANPLSRLLLAVSHLLLYCQPVELNIEHCHRFGARKDMTCRARCAPLYARLRRIRGRFLRCESPIALSASPGADRKDVHARGNRFSQRSRSSGSLSASGDVTGEILILCVRAPVSPSSGLPSAGIRVRINFRVPAES